MLWFRKYSKNPQVLYITHVIQYNTMNTVTFKLQEDIVNKIDSMLGHLNFNNRTEFIRDAIRTKLNEAEKEQVLRKLADFKGRLKGRSKMNDKEASDLASTEIAKKFGIKLN